MGSLLPIIGRSNLGMDWPQRLRGVGLHLLLLIGNNGFIVAYYWPEQLGD